MPTYDYRCEACSHEFEAFQSMTANALRKCPACGKLKLRRLIGTGAGIIFKGSGFYETDYRSDGYQKAAKADKEAAAPKSESKGDAKKSDAGSGTGTTAAKSEKPAKASGTAKG